MRISYISHGYPPRENAGTEQHCKLVAEGMKDRGHEVQIIAATRSYGRRHGEVINEKSNLHRIVNNFPARHLSQLERDRSLEKPILELVENFSPDVIHIHHLQFLSSGLRFPQPTIFTLHDGWTWCAAGGTELLPDGTVCEGPVPEKCTSCASKWAPQPTKAANFLIKTAGLLSPLISSENLHKIWQKVPQKIRNPIAQGKGSQITEPPKFAAKRNQTMKEQVQSFTMCISPSKYLAQKGEKMGINNIIVIPHGVDRRQTHSGGNGLVFIGTIAPHKGPDLVQKAYDIAFPSQQIPLHFFGPVITKPKGLTHKINPPLTREEVWETLQHADALVIGSKWPENCPMIIIEAKATGCPVIAPSIGGIPELISDGVDGFLYHPNDPLDLARAIKKTLQYRHFKVSPPMSLQQQLDEIEACYHKVL